MYSVQCLCKMTLSSPDLVRAGEQRELPRAASGLWIANTGLLQRKKDYYKCDQCSGTFVKENQVPIHVTEQHQKCEFCGQKFKKHCKHNV